MAQAKVFKLGNIGCSGSCSCGGCTSKICLTNGCNAANKIVGATVQVFSGATLIDTQLTDSTGCALMNIGTAGTYTVKYQLPSGDPVTAPGTPSLTCGGTTAFSGFSGAVGASCCGNCPIPLVLTLTDAFGTFVMTFNGSGTSGPGWYGQATVTYGSCLITPTTVGFQCFCVLGSGSITVFQTMLCKAASSTSPPTFQVSRGYRIANTGNVGLPIACGSGGVDGYACSDGWTPPLPGCPIPTINLGAFTAITASTCWPFSFSAPIASGVVNDPLGSVTVTR